MPVEQCAGDSTMSLRSPLIPAVLLFILFFTSIMVLQSEEWFLKNTKRPTMKVIPAPPTTPTRTRAVRVAVCREDQKSDGAIFRTITEALFPPGGPAYNATYIETDNGIIPSPHNQADFLACLGYFYPKNFTQHRSDIGDRYGRLEPPEGKKGHFDSDTGVYWPEKVDLVPHRDRPFQFSFSGEAWDRGHCRYDVMIICTKNFDKFHGCPIIFWPYYASSFFRRHLWPTLLPKVANVPAYDATQKAAILRSKNEFCAFIVSHCWNPVYANNDVMARVIFFDFIAENYKQPSALGHCRRKAENNGRIAERWANPSAVGDLDPVVEAFRPFKFALVFENNGKQTFRMYSLPCHLAIQYLY